MRLPWRTKGWILRWVAFRVKRRDPAFAPTRRYGSALLAMLFGLVMLPWAILQRLTYDRVALPSVASGCPAPPRSTGWRWRGTILGWANARGSRALADVYHGHDLTGLPAALAAPGATVRRSCTTATSSSSTRGRPPAGRVGALVFRRLSGVVAASRRW